MEQDNYPYSVCENFITPETELISAWYVMQTEKKQNHISVYQHYLNRCDDLGISHMEDELNKMIVLDYLILNEDRNLNNFGVIRHAETLEWLGAAPIFDNGTSHWHDKPVTLIYPHGKFDCKPFKNDHVEQIKLVTDFEWLELNELVDIEDIFRGIVKDSIFVDEKRADSICHSFRGRVTILKSFINEKSKNNYFTGLDTKNDVKKDIKYSGSKKKMNNDFEL